MIRMVPGSIPWPSLAGFVGLLLAMTMVWRRRRSEQKEQQWQRARLEELEAYGRFEGELPGDSEPRKLADQAKRVCRLVAEKSVFARAALLVRNREGRLVCAGSGGMDDLTLAAIDQFGEGLMRDEPTDVIEHAVGRERGSGKSFPVVLGEWGTFGAIPDCHEATIIPLRLSRGRLVGVLAVCPGAALQPGERQLQGGQTAQAIMPLEILASKLARTLERGLLIERLLELKRLAGAGQIVASVARELTAPVTAVLSLAESVAETASEPRVRQDGEAIAERVTEMRETLRRLSDFWKPREAAGEPKAVQHVHSVQVMRVRDVA